MKKFLYLFFLLPFGQIFGAEGGQENGDLNKDLLNAFSSAISANQSALSRFITRAGDCRFTAQMPPPPPPFLLPPPPPPPFLLPPPPPPPFLFPPIPLPGQSAQSFTPDQDQNPSIIILKGRPVQPQLPPAAAPITAFSSPAAPALPPAPTVSIPPLPTTVAPIRATTDQNQSHEPHQVEGFCINPDGNYQCTHPGCDKIIDTVHRDTLTRHRRTHIIRYKCSKCFYTSDSSYNVQRHIASKEEKCLGAAVEKVTSSSAIGDNVGNEAPFLPDFPTGDQTLTRASDLDEAFIAQLLGQAADTNLPTVSTFAALAQKQPFQCDLCERSFASELILKRHKASEHSIGSVNEI